MADNKYVLDSDTVSALLNGHQGLQQRIASVTDESVCLKKSLKDPLWEPTYPVTLQTNHGEIKDYQMLIDSGRISA
jgi:hypothetical protein